MTITVFTLSTLRYHATITAGEWLLTHVARATRTISHMIALTTSIIWSFIMFRYYLFVFSHVNFVQIWDIFTKVATRILSSTNRLVLLVLWAFWQIYAKRIEVLLKFRFFLIDINFRWLSSRFKLGIESAIKLPTWSSLNTLVKINHWRNATRWIVYGLSLLITLMIHFFK